MAVTEARKIKTKSNPKPFARLRHNRAEGSRKTLPYFTVFVCFSVFDVYRVGE
jgi:hypothetical protein